MAETSDIEKRELAFRKVVGESPAVAFIWEVSEGWPVRYVSDSIKLFGYKPEEFESGAIRYKTLIHPDDQEAITAEVEANLQAKLPSFEQQYRLLTRSGEVRWVRDWTTVNQDENGEVESVQGIILDVTNLLSTSDYYRNILNSSGNLFLIIDQDGRVKDFNDRTCEIVGVSEIDLMGRVWIDDFVPKEQRADVESYLQTISSSSSDERWEFENEIVSRDGHRRLIHWYHTAKRSPQGGISELIGFGADVTEERKIASRASVYADLSLENPNPVFRIDLSGDVILANNAAQGLMNSLTQANWDESKALQSLIKLASRSKAKFQRDVKFNDMTYLFQVVPVGDEGYVDLYGLNITEQEILSDQLQQITRNVPGAIFTYVLNEDGTDQIEFANEGCEVIYEVSAEELHNDPTALWSMVHPEDVDAMRDSVMDSASRLIDWQHEWRITPNSGTTKWLRGRGTPIKRKDGSIAWMTIVIDQSDIKNSEQAISQALQKTIFVLAAALEKRDPYTAGHEERVTEIAKLIAREMHLDKSTIQGVEFAAMVHDVGKIVVPAEILSKPGKLSDAEFELIKAHPDVGADLLKDIQFDWPIAEIIRQHHERIDGSGYPKGLKGDQILLEARIIAVADVLEAMASHRPYRSSLGLEKAAEEIKQGAGIRYDARVAEACLKLVSQSRIRLPN